MCVLVLLTSGFSTFTTGNWDTSVFVSSYLCVPRPRELSLADRCCASRDIPLVIAVFTLWKYFHKTEVVSLARIPLQEALDQVEERETGSEANGSLFDSDGERESGRGLWGGRDGNDGNSGMA